MSTLEVETLEGLSESLNAAAALHMSEIRGLPLTSADILARFLLYAAVLRQVYQMDDSEMLSFCKLGDKCKLDFQASANRMGNA